MENKKVTIYSTPTCHFCHAAKAFFDENGVTYTDNDVAVDQEKRQEMIEDQKVYINSYISRSLLGNGFKEGNLIPQLLNILTEGQLIWPSFLMLFD